MKTVHYTKRDGTAVIYRYPGPKGDTICRLTEAEKGELVTYAKTHINDETAARFSVSVRTVQRLKKPAKARTSGAPRQVRKLRRRSGH